MRGKSVVLIACLLLLAWSSSHVAKIDENPEPPELSRVAFHSASESVVLSRFQGTPHPPIYISGNGGFVVGQNGVTGGSGTANDPYTLEGWDIDASNGDGISISNVNINFLIRDCYIHNGNRGIIFTTVTNGGISENNISSNGVGILLSSKNESSFSYGNTISNNTICSNGRGIGLGLFSNTNIVSHNNISHNGFFGISMYGSRSNTLWSNTFQDDGIFMDHDNMGIMSHFIHTITPNNTVNGKPVYYYLNQTGLDIDSIPVGQLILVNCSNCMVSDINVSNTAVGAELAFSSNITIKDSTFSQNYHGVYMFSSSNNTISNNSISYNNHTSIYLNYFNANNMISDNNISHAAYGAIWLIYSDSNTITCNIISEHNAGIGTHSSYTNTIHGNTICSVNTVGIYILSQANTISDNTILASNMGIQLGGISHSVYNNNISKNSIGIDVCGSSDNVIYDNNISDNGCGVRLHAASNANTISYNNIVNSTDYGVNITADPTANLFHHNNFVNNHGATSAYDYNHVQACDPNGYNFWDTSAEGNYWCDWTTPDSNGDGIVDSPYILHGGTGAKDNYPLTGVVPIDMTRPARTTDLAVSDPTTDSLRLTWTAPADNGTDPNSGSASGYDIRYSTTGVIDTDVKFNMATQCTGVPTPGTPGFAEAFIVSGLNSGTTYWFALKTCDEVPNWSDLSNCASGTTIGDTTPPAGVTDLSAGSLTQNAIALTWTAPGDDGMTGTASQYDIRYLAGSTPITDANWGTATQCTNEPVPGTPGSTETFTVTGLSPNTQYWFALKTADKKPNWSPISNSPTATTTAPPVQDTIPPAAVTNLTAGNPTKLSITLTWTAPADNGTDASSGYASQYEIRYLAGSTPITDANWNSATQCAGIPAPGAPGSTETFTVTGLSPGTQYHFALKTTDEVPNWSPISNSPTATTWGSGGPQLVIISADTVDENTDFDVTIIAEGNPVEGVKVTFNSVDKTTDANGDVTFTAPSVATDTLYMVTANKTSYTDMTKAVTVKDIPLQPALSVTVTAEPTTIVSGGNVAITVKVTSSTSDISGATMTVSDDGAGGSFSTITDKGNGEYGATYTAPTQSAQKIVTIKATAVKSGYGPGTGQTNITVSSGLTLLVTVTAEPTTVDSGESVSITVRVTSDGSGITGATVSLSDGGAGGAFSSVTDNGNGDYTATYTAPTVNTQRTITIKATAAKNGYSPGQGQREITVTPAGGFPAPAMLFVAVIVAVAVIVVLVLLQKRMRKKKRKRKKHPKEKKSKPSAEDKNGSKSGEPQETYVEETEQPALEPAQTPPD